MIKRLIFLTSAFLSFALFAAKDDTAIANRKWVREFIAGNAAQMMNDDEIHADGTNTWIYEKKVIDGVITNVRQDLTVKLIEEYGNKPGAIILSSTNPKLKGGNLGCINYFHTIPEIPSETRPTLVNTSSRHTYTAKDGETIDAGYAFFALALTQTKTDPQGEYKTYSVAYTHQAMRYRREVTSDEITSAKDILSVTDKIEYTSISGEVERQEVYLYKIKGALLSDFSFNAATAPHSDETTSVWMEDAEKIPRRYLSFTAKKDIALFKSTPSILDLFFPRAFAADVIQTYLSGLELWSDPVINTWIDSFAFASGDITKDTHVADPKISPSPEEWQDPMRWFRSYPNDPFPLKVFVQYDDPDLGTYTREKRINNLKTLQNLNGVVIVKPYPFPSFREKDTHKYCDRGDHIWGADCKCTICGSQREHNYTFDHVGEGKCARCSNHFSEYEDDRDGVPYPTGEKKEVCDRNCDMREEEYHRGWHDVDHPENEKLYCDCECGYYHKTESLAHIPVFDPEEDILYTDSGDGINHETEMDCARNCGAKIKFKEKHKFDINAELPPEIERECIPFPDPLLYSEIHIIDAICTAKGCGYIGKLEERHHFDHHPCYCELCELYTHKYEEVACGPYKNLYCTRDGCNAKPDEDPDKPSKHYYIEGTDPDVHYCECGREQEKHTWILRGNNYYCSVCGQMKENDFKSHRKCRYKSNDNEDETHTESPKGVSPDDPDLSTGTSCTYCKRQVISDIPEWKREQIRTNLKDLPVDFYVPSEFNYLPWCWYSIVLKHETNNDASTSIKNFYCYTSEDNAGMGTTFGFIAETANSWVAPQVSLAKNSKLNTWGLISLHYPYDYSNKDKANCANFTSGCLIDPKTDLEYDEIEYFFEIKKDENSGEYNLFWD